MEIGKFALKRIESTAYKFQLDVTRVNEDTLQISSKKYIYDSWLIQKDGKRLTLLHLNKKGCSNKCTYHIQKTVSAYNWNWLLQKINQHNTYVITHKWNARENMVDKIMRNYNNERNVKNAKVNM